MVSSSPSRLCSLGKLAIVLSLLSGACGINLSVSSDGGNASSPLLYGFMFEDINYSGDGGIYGQLLKNNGLQSELNAFAAVGSGTIAVDTENPLTSTIPQSLRIDVAEDASGVVGFSNSGYWGIPVDGSVFQTIFWVKGSFTGDVTVRLVGNGTEIEYASTVVSVEAADDFTYITTDLPTEKAPDGEVYYELTVDASAVAGQSLYFGLPQLFPETFKSRENGLKPNLANVLDTIKGSFLRWGGNNLEGNSEDQRWKWNETIGPVEDRPGRQGAWGYYNSDGLGLMEYLYWCEDLGLAPILGVWAGFALQSGGNTPFTGDVLTPYVDDVLNELEFVLGDKSTTYGSLRASYGEENPFPVTMVEIGNEDNLGGGCESYAERFTAFYDAIHAAYPDLQIITSTADPACLPSPVPEGVWLDYHLYAVPDDLVADFGYFDNLDRSYPYFIGEYAQSEATWPTMQGAVGEAVYMIGFERNSDVVKMAAYAPLFQLVNATQWVPDLIPYTQTPDSVIETPSYYVQQMFSANRGDTILPVTSDAEFGPVYWVASSNEDSVIVKLANYGADVQDLTLSIPDVTGGHLTIVASDDAAAANTDSETVVVPTEKDVTAAADGSVAFTLPAWSVAVFVSS
ncbi:glycoside hydrolase superfamily [Aspergillus cavernicola]|uniref:non-reducing end alpha-L-arabinofuranosidase n=1 Tax=Aspergillus cavernicola TaxID=176166 RepID=A0ABR4IED6_9EURO